MVRGVAGLFGNAEMFSSSRARAGQGAPTLTLSKLCTDATGEEGNLVVWSDGSQSEKGCQRVLMIRAKNFIHRSLKSKISEGHDAER